MLCLGNSCVQNSWILLTKPTTRQSSLLLASAPVRQFSSMLPLGWAAGDEGITLVRSTPKTTDSSRTMIPAPPPRPARPPMAPRRSCTCVGSSPRSLNKSCPPRSLNRPLNHREAAIAAALTTDSRALQRVASPCWRSGAVDFCREQCTVLLVRTHPLL